MEPHFLRTSSSDTGDAKMDIQVYNFNYTQGIYIDNKLFYSGPIAAETHFDISLIPDANVLPTYHSTKSGPTDWPANETDMKKWAEENG